MAASFVDVRNESALLRRAAFLLERVRQDGCVDPDLDALSAGVSAIRRLAADGRPIHRSAIQKLEKIYARIAPSVDSPAGGTVDEILCWNALTETKELLRLLHRSSSRAAHRSAPGARSHAHV